MTTRSTLLSTITIGLLLQGTTLALQPKIRYVKTSATGSGNCDSWANACTLSAGLAAALSIDQVWCKNGTYNLTETLTLKNGVKLIGGFAGTETLAKQSQWTGNRTILDGGGTVMVVYGEDNDASTVLRGFTVKNGVAEDGGGMYLWSSDALIVDCVFENNGADWFGGAVMIRGNGSPQFINTIFRNNGQTATHENYGAGAVFAYDGSPQFVNCLFHNNQAQEGGAVMVNFAWPIFINCTFAGNRATTSYGGAIADQNGYATLKNCIVWGNTSARSIAIHKQIYCGSGGSTLATYSDIQGGWVGSTILNANPLFRNPKAGDFSLMEGSPCIDAGEDAALPPDAGNLDWDMDTDEITPRDLSGRVRTGSSPVDMGPYEGPQATGEN